MRFILIDRITRIEREKMASGIKHLAMSEDYFEDHFPCFPLMPGALMLEAMIQLGSWLILYSTEFKFIGRLSRLYDAKVRRSAQPGDSLNVEVEWMERTDTGIVFYSRILSKGKGVLEARFENRLIEAKREERASLEKLYRFLTTRFMG